MAENGFFRVSLRGFNKKDVLNYIDELQATHSRRLAESEELRLEAEQALQAEKHRASDEAGKIEALESANATLTEQVEKLTALAQIYKAELLSLRDQVASGEQAKEEADQLKQALAENRELQEQNALLKEQNARYATVVGDVSRVVVEARVVSASYLDSAQQKSSECIEELDAFLSDLKGKVETVRKSAAANRKAGTDHIETLLSDLKELGETLPATKSKKK